MIKKLLFVCLAVALVLPVTACVPSVNLKTEALTKGNPKGQAVAIGSVVNKRDEGYGNEDFQRLGTVRGGFGNPFSVKAESGREIDTVLKEVAKSALDHNGYSSEQGGRKPLRLDMDVLKFWCDGYTGYKVEADVAVKLVDPATGKILAKKDIQAREGFAVVFGYGQMHEAFNDVLTQIQKEVVSFVKSDDFAKAAR